MFNRCSHKFGEIQEDGYQYCEKCNTAISVPCNHKWEELKEYTKVIVSGITKSDIGYTFILKCKRCGELKTINSRIINSRISDRNKSIYSS